MVSKIAKDKMCCCVVFAACCVGKAELKLNIVWLKTVMHLPLTCLTHVVSNEVGLELFLAATVGCRLQLRIDHSDVTATSSRAARVEDVQHRHRTADVAEIGRHAPADCHATVVGVLDDDHFVVTASWTERLRYTVVCSVNGS